QKPEREGRAPFNLTALSMCPALADAWASASNKNRLLNAGGFGLLPKQAYGLLMSSCEAPPSLFQDDLSAALPLCSSPDVWATPFSRKSHHAQGGGRLPQSAFHFFQPKSLTRLTTLLPFVVSGLSNGCANHRALIP